MAMAKSSISAPKRRQCGTMAVHHRLLEQYDSYRTALLDLERLVQRRMASGDARRAQLVTIPVVVHVVYQSKAEHVSVAQVKSQIAALNRDYAAENQDRSKVPAVWRGLVSDTGIRFALASKSPSGKRTHGITRTKTQRDFFGDDDSVKSRAGGGADPWPTDRYLNLWVCSLAGGLLGYAQFPGGPAATDGVVILDTAFGTQGTAKPPFNLGRTATHEVGHWLNLRHIWGDTEHCEGTDFVSDTPNQQRPNYGQPKFPHISCGNGPSGDMFVNYMDYVDDAAMVMFTTQQVARMQATLDGPRASLIARP
jgi:hypothetical protein